MSLKIHFLSSHPQYSTENCGSVSDEHGERFHQDFAAMEGRCKRKWSLSMFAVYFSKFNRQAKKVLLH
jgi:hypothetical protein